MADYNTLSLQQKVLAALPAALATDGINNPPTTLQDRDNLNRAIGSLDADIQNIKDLSGAIGGQFVPINVADFPELQTFLQPFVPPGYTLTTITLNEIINVAEGVKTEYEKMAKAISSGSSPTIARGLPTPAAASPAPVTTPPATVNPKPKSKDSILEKLAKGAAAVGAVAAVGALANSLKPSNRQGLTQQAREQASLKDSIDWADKADWRVRLSLANAGKYLYQAADPGILAPLAATKGIVFPYTPSIQVTYSANYDTASLQHSNYKVVQYQNSSVEQVSISCDFTAQSTNEANYVLAVIHFLRSVTKMFYGKDENPTRGTPPPLCYLTGLGQYQFNAHPLVVTGFTYSLPTDVDYIKAFSPSSVPSKNENPTAQGNRINQGQGNAAEGGLPNPPNFSKGSNPPTYIPTKINIQISALPVVARNVISNDFSLQDYATGKLLLGKNNSSGGGIW